MTFDEILAQIIELLQRQGRVSYRALKLRFALDDDYLEAVKDELIHAKQQAVDEDNRVLVWIGEPSASPTARPEDDSGAASITNSDVPSSSPIPQVLDSLPGERRQVTIVFADISGFTALSEQRDPEDVRSLMNACFAQLVPIIEHYGGTVDKFIGDEIMALFGAPVAHENDAYRAVRTALEMMDALTLFNTSQGTDLGLHCGINTGIVIAGNLGTESRQEYSVMGDAVNLAARLEDASERGQIFVGPETYRLTRRYFTFEPPQFMSFKGKAEPVPVYHVLGFANGHAQLEQGEPTEFTPFVGREAEVNLLLDHWERVTQGTGHVILLSGEAGIGKSRLLQVLRDRVKRGSHVRLECRCSPYHQQTPFYPLVELWQRLLQWETHKDATSRLARLEQVLASYSLPLAETVPIIAGLLSLAVPEERYPAFTTSQQQRQRAMEIFITILQELAARQPVLFAVEDVHWADPSTLEFFQLMMEQIPTTALLMVLTYRPVFQPPWMPKTHITPIMLQRLLPRQVEAIISSLTGHKTFPDVIVQQIMVKTDGVPLFVEELTKTVIESKWLEEDEDRYLLQGPLPSLAIPATLQDSLMARLDRLPWGKEVAQLAATIGRQFPYGLLRAVAPWEDATLQQGLQQLVDAELCYQRGALPQATYLFKHALVRDAAYDSLLRSRRRHIHGQIARVLEHDPDGIKNREPETIAYHFEAAQEIKPAIFYWEKAGQQARQRSANQEAATHFIHAIDLLSSIMEAHEQAELELRIRVELGGQLIACHGNGAPSVEENYLRAQALLNSVYDRRLAFRARHGLRTFYMTRGPLQKAKELGEQLLALAYEIGDESLLLQAHRPHGLCIFYMGELEPARHHLERAIALYRPETHGSQRFEYISDPLVLARCNLGWLCCFLGDRDCALDQAKQAIAFAKQLDHKHSLAFALSLAASTWQAYGEMEATRSLAERILELAQTYSYPYWIAWAKMLLGWVRGRTGELGPAAAEIQEGLRSYQETGALQMLPYFLVLLSEVEIQHRDPDKALLHLEEAQKMMQITGTRFYEAELYRLKGCLLADLLNEPQAARHMFLQALEIASRQGNALLRNYAQQSLEALLGQKYRPEF